MQHGSKLIETFKTNSAHGVVDVPILRSAPPAHALVVIDYSHSLFRHK